ncbi:MAG: NF038129 family PEP-CTERM protein [Acidobacteriota bacterium]
MSGRRFLSTAFLVTVLTNSALAASYEVRLNTTALMGHAAGPFWIAFQLTDGSASGNRNNTVVLSQFNFGGGSVIGQATLLGGVSGGTGSQVMFTDSSLINQLTQRFQPGTQLTFRVSFTTNEEADGTPDAFSFSLLDGSGTEIPTQGGENFDVLVSIRLGASNPDRVRAFAGDSGRRPPSGAATIAIPAPVLTAFQLVSSASYMPRPVAPDSIVSAFGGDLSKETAAAAGPPLPTELGGTVVKVRDSAGTVYPANLYFASPDLVNFVMPTGVNGPNTISIGGADAVSVDAAVSRIAPGVFMLSGTLAAAHITRVANGKQTLEDVYQLNGTSIIPKPIAWNAASDELYLILYGTGIRGRSDRSSVKVKIGGVSLPALYAGAQPSSPGLDQVNVGPLSRAALQGKGEVDVILEVEGETANTTTLYFQ